MAVDRIPLLGEYNTRGVSAASPASGKDYRLINFVPRLVADSVSKTLTPYVERRSGLESSVTVDSSAGDAIFYWRSSLQPIACREVGGSGFSTVYAGDVSLGDADDNIISISEGRFAGIATLMFTTGSSGWYLPVDSFAVTAYTADGNNSTTITDIKISGVNSVAGLYVGQKLSAASNIAAGSRIASINPGAFSAALTAATTGGAFNDLAITKEPLAKITSANFPSAPTYMQEIDGRAYAIDKTTLRVHESDLNDVSTWGANAYVTMDADVGGVSGNRCFLGKINQRLYAFCGQRIEVYHNNNNQSGAVISRIDEATIEMGAANFCATDDALYFTGHTKGAYDGLFVISGGAGPAKISTPTLDSMFSSVSALYNLNPSVFSFWGQTVIYLQTGTSTGWLWFVESKKMAEFSSTGAMIFAGSGAGDGTIAAYALQKSNGTLYIIRAATPAFQDNGSTFTATVQTARWTGGTQKRKTIHSIRLLGMDKQSSGVATLAYSDDDYATFTTLGTFDLTSMDPVIRPGKSHKGGRSYKLTHAVNAAFRAVALEIEYTVSNA